MKKYIIEQFDENFRSKTRRFVEIRSLFRNYFLLNRGFKGLRIQHHASRDLKGCHTHPGNHKSALKNCTNAVSTSVTLKQRCWSKFLVSQDLFDGVLSPMADCKRELYGGILSPIR